MFAVTKPTFLNGGRMLKLVVFSLSFVPSFLWPILSGETHLYRMANGLPYHSAYSTLSHPERPKRSADFPILTDYEHCPE